MSPAVTGLLLSLPVLAVVGAAVLRDEAIEAKPPRQIVQIPCVTDNLYTMMQCVNTKQLVVTGDRLRQLVREKLDQDKRQGHIYNDLTPRSVACDLIGLRIDCQDYDITEILPFVQEWLDENRKT